jgi:phenylpropionate dioxygenase-like ring-hydroxylating dioxygenase large terminal subunit
VRDWEQELLDRLNRAAASGRPLMSERSGTIPAENYASPERLALERRHVFQRFPLLVGLSSMARHPGDFFTHDHTGVPILVVRGRDGELRAFINACRHRGVKVACEPAGSGKSTFICRYHGWSYDLDGRLRGVPLEYGFPGLDRSGRGLVPLPVGERFGLVFVRLEPDATLDLGAFLGPMCRDLEDFELDRHVVFESSSRTVSGNWKLMIDANLEVYHVPVLHKRTGAPLFRDHLLVHDAWDPHARFLLPHQQIPGFPSAADEHRGIRKHAGVLYFIFPNTFVFFMIRGVNVLVTFPVDESHCRVNGFTLVEDGPADPVAREFLKVSYNWYWSTILEDIEVVEAAQPTLHTGANRDLLVGRYEFGLQRFHGLLQDAIAQRSGSSPGPDLAMPAAGELRAR